MMRTFILASVAILAGCNGEAAVTEEQALIEEARAAMRNDLKDPQSANFQEGPLSHVHVQEGLVCGEEVNAKNSYGGYTGFERYYYRRGIGAFTIGDPQALSIIEACTQAVKDDTARIKAETAEMENPS